MANPYAPPNAPVSDLTRPGEEEFEYAGFWMRFVAFVIDNIILALIIVPVLWWTYGGEYFLREDESMFAGTVDFFRPVCVPRGRDHCVLAHEAGDARQDALVASHRGCKNGRQDVARAGDRALLRVHPFDCW